MRPLPVAPDFDVYGLVDGRLGQAWLELWNQAGGVGRGPIAHVNLGYGPETEPDAFVITYADPGPHKPTSTESSYPSSGPLDAAISGLQYLYNAARQRGFAPFTSANQEVSEIVRLANSFAEPEWEIRQVDVAGRTLSAHVYYVKEIWVALVSPPHVAVSIVGLHVPLEGLSIAPIDTQFLTDKDD